MTRLVEALPTPPSLLILTYHRVGDAQKTPYDSGTFSCTTAELDRQVGYLKQRFPIVNLDQAVELVHDRATAARASVLLTFDDGYRDNYDEAFPVLRRNGVSATFFLPTAFVGTSLLPWWDTIAYIAKNSKRDRIALTYPPSPDSQPAEFDLTPANRTHAIVAILKLFKHSQTADAESFISQLEAACDCPRPTASAERCFLNWDEAREMQANGMCFGSHTHTHEIMGKLPYTRQLEELTTSRAILERELGRPIDTLAYPVGQPDSFSPDTFKALAAANYSSAFSFYRGINIPGTIAPFDVLRRGVDGESPAIFRLRIALRATTRKELF